MDGQDAQERHRQQIEWLLGFPGSERSPRGRSPRIPVTYSLVGGLPRDERHPHPGIYPESNAPQGWPAGMVVLLMQALLGMRPVAPLGLLLIDPHLPPWLPDLRLSGVRVGQTRIDLTSERRTDGTTRWRVARCEGRIRVLRQPVPQGPGSSLGGRASALLASLVGS